jgi:hypothetical protein
MREGLWNEFNTSYVCVTQMEVYHGKWMGKSS